MMRLSLLDLLPAPGAAHGNTSQGDGAACHVPPVAAPVVGGTPCARSWLLFLSPADPMTCLCAYLVVHMEYGRGQDSERGALVPALGRAFRGADHQSVHTRGHAGAMQCVGVRDFADPVMGPLLSVLLERVATDSGLSPFCFLNREPMNPASHGFIASTVAWSGETRDFIPGPFPAGQLVSAGALHRIYLQPRDYHGHMQPQSLNF